MKIDGNRLLASLKNVKWDTLVKTYGNNHSTMVGLLVDWWISISPKHHSALEGGPSNGYKQRGQCDALLCHDSEAVGVVEVEGSRHEETVKKIGTFFNAKREDYKTLEFGVLLTYSYRVVPNKEGRLLKAEIPEARIREVTGKHRQKSLIVIALDKDYESKVEGVRAISGYYKPQTSRIEGVLYTRGRENRRLLFYPRNGRKARS